MKSLSLALVGFVVACTIEITLGSRPTSTEVPLIRCKRPLCERRCSLGFQVDNNGCETCRCVRSCVDLRCKEDQLCKEVHGRLKCVDAENAFPEENCAMHCVFGFRRDKDGSDVCECKATPCDGFTCPSGMRCISESGDCDDKGNCNLKALCVPDERNIQRLPCPLPMCAMDHECEFGFKLTEMGCQTCQCRTSVCDTEKCPEGEFCTEHMTKCTEEICPFEPKCIGKPLCHRQQELHRLASSILMPGPAIFRSPRVRRETTSSPVRTSVAPGSMLQCDEKGAFKPLQCSAKSAECWCVDDRGQEIPGSRKMSTEMPRPDCHYNRTKGVHGSFQMKHSLDNVEPHMKNIKQLTHQHLSHWLHMDEEYVTIVAVTPHEAYSLQVHFQVIWDQETDMATAVYHLQYLMIKGRCQINYQGGTLMPDPQTMAVQHHYGPQVPDESGWTGEHLHHDSGFMRFVHCHQTGIIVAVFGATMLILLIAIVSFARRRRLNASFNHRRMDTYKENLAFSNQLYGKQNLMGEDVKEPLPDVQLESDTKKPTEVVA